MSKFKVGDLVKVKEGGGYLCDHEERSIEAMRESGFKSEGEEHQFTGKIIQIEWSKRNQTNFYRVNNINWVSENGLEFQNESLNKLTKNIMTNLTQKFINAFKPEPYKTLREKEITNGDDMLTDEGKDLYINYLFQKDAATFKTEVADKIEEEK